MMMLPGSSRERICSSYVTTRSLSVVPGSRRVVAPAAMMQLSNVTVSVPFAVATSSVFGSVKVPRPSYSVILFFFIRKWTPLTRPSATERLRSNAAPKSKRISPSEEMPKVFASCWTRWASSALRRSAFEGMQPTFRQTPPQYFSSTIAVFSPSCAARIAATYPPGPAPSTTTSKCSDMHPDYAAGGASFAVVEGAGEAEIRPVRGRRRGSSGRSSSGTRRSPATPSP